MFGPYRTLPPSSEPVPRNNREARGVAWVMLALGCVRVAVAVAMRDVARFEPVLATALVIAGLGVLRRGMFRR